MSYQGDRDWSDGFIPALRYIVGPLLVEPSSLVQDQEQAADLVVFTARSVTIACRVRRPGYSEMYPYDFTIRSWRPTGVKTELAKINEGWGDWFVYAHANPDELNLDRWMVLDLDVFRSAWANDRRVQLAPERPNRTDGTKFRAFDVRWFAPDIVIAAKPKVRTLVSAPV